mmetsp:Transcript_29226/g.38437  ORF Transcript_29226/g.38437 Transcript_29226/m.38437 type:complete len:426 (-) Transcript_29226:275-1552(-)
MHHLQPSFLILFFAFSLLCSLQNAEAFIQNGNFLSIFQNSKTWNMMEKRTNGPSMHHNFPVLNMMNQSSVSSEMESISSTEHLTWGDLKIAMDMKSRDEVVKVLESMKDNSDIQLWNSTFLYYRRYQVEDVVMMTKIRGDLIEKLGLDGKSDVDKIASVLFAVIIGSILSSLTVLQNLPGPEIIRFSAVWVLAFAPYGYLTLGLSFPATLQKLLIQIFRTIDPSYRDRLLYHEAGHFLVGYLVGMPVASYSADSPVNAVQFYPLQGIPVQQLAQGNNDENEKDEQINAETLRKLWTKINQDPNGPTTKAVEEGMAVARSGKITLEALQRLCVTSLAGVMAECIQLGNGEGGYADLVQLQNFLYFCEKKLTDREQQEYVRWGAIQSYTMLENYRDELDNLVEAFKNDASVAECIQVIEQTRSAKNK